MNCKSTELASDGSFNLIFHPKSLLYDTIVTLEIHYWFEKQNGKKFLEWLFNKLIYYSLYIDLIILFKKWVY